MPPTVNPVLSQSHGGKRVAFTSLGQRLCLLERQEKGRSKTGRETAAFRASTCEWGQQGKELQEEAIQTAGIYGPSKSLSHPITEDWEGIDRPAQAEEASVLKSKGACLQPGVN